MVRKFRILHGKSPGDITVLTALVRDIKRAYGNQVLVDVKTTCGSLWDNNPYITPLALDDQSVQAVQACYKAGIRNQKTETIHFLTEFHKNFKLQTGLNVPLTEPKPDLHLSDDERLRSPIAGRYWVFLSGGKSDFTIKVWHNQSWITACELLRQRGIPLVQLGGADKGHWHPEVPGVLDLVGRTSLRDMVRIIHHADGVICGVTAAAHIAAALERPCVVIAGGREAWWWEAYVRENAGLACPTKLKVPHKFLHTIGLLDCCKTHGCWKNKVVPLHNDPLLCKRPIVLPGQSVAECMNMITPEMVVTAVESYYLDGTLPPLIRISPLNGTKTQVDNDTGKIGLLSKVQPESPSQAPGILPAVEPEKGQTAQPQSAAQKDGYYAGVL